MMRPEPELPIATDGEIAAINLEGARRHAWARFAQDPRRLGLAESILYHEHLAAQFLGDVEALDRLDSLTEQLAEDSARTELIHAEIASAGHRFVDARAHLARAAQRGASPDLIERQTLTIDQACGVDLEAVLATRRRVAEASGALEDLVPLGAVFADLERFEEADALYRRALYAYNDVSPFPLAWVCFQLGMLWGELVPEPDPELAAPWYRRAIVYLPAYVKARVHLTEILTNQGQVDEAEALLLPALSSADSEVRWRLADVMTGQERFEKAEIQVEAARSGFEELLQRHLLAFADHAAEFYAGSGNDHRRALELARVNVANRPTRRAIEQAQAIAADAASRCRKRPARNARAAAGQHSGRSGDQSLVC